MKKLVLFAITVLVCEQCFAKRTPKNVDNKVHNKHDLIELDSKSEDEFNRAPTGKNVDSNIKSSFPDENKIMKCSEDFDELYDFEPIQEDQNPQKQEPEETTETE